MRFLKKILKKMIIYPIRIRKGKILFISTTKTSGCNVTALYYYILKRYDNIQYLEYKHNMTLKEKIVYFQSLASSEVIITSHINEKIKKNQKLVQLWHGIPLKAMGLLDKTYDKKWNKYDRKEFNKIDIIISTSNMYTTLLNSTIGQISRKYKVLGYPRNDMLIQKKDISFKVIFNNFNKHNKNIFYIPTFKEGYNDRREGNDKQKNPFGIENLDMNKLSLFLKTNNLNLIMKLHPFEEDIYKKIIKEYDLENIYFLTAQMLENAGKDLYEFLGESDLLITDYSSIYFDYLLTQKPILFINPDEEKYRNSRGFLLEPYDFWTPGPKVKSLSELSDEVINLLSDKLYYEKERRLLLNMMHKYKDYNSCERIWEFIEKKYLNRGEI